MLIFLQSLFLKISKFFIIKFMYTISYFQILLGNIFKNDNINENICEVIKSGKVDSKMNIDVYTLSRLDDNYDIYDFIIYKKYISNRIYGKIIDKNKINELKEEITQDMLIKPTEYFINIELTIEDLLEPFEISLKTPLNFYFKNTKLLTKEHIVYLLYQTHNYILEKDVPYELEIMDNKYNTLKLNNDQYMIYKDDKWIVC